MGSTSLAPGLLLAAPQLGDPNFERTVVLLGRHEPEGALGWVLNGRALASVRELLTDARLVPAGFALPETEGFHGIVRVGGPVSGGTGWLVYRATEGFGADAEVDVGPELRVCGDPKAFDALLHRRGPDRFRLVLGYAGWGPGQLEGEVRQGAWLPAAVSADLVLDASIENLWERAYQRAIGTLPGAFTANKVGSA